MNRETGDRSLPSRVGQSLRDAFRHHGTKTARPWNVKVLSLGIPEGDPVAAARLRCLRVELTSADAQALTEVLRMAAELSAITGNRGPGRTWLGSDEVARRIGVKPGTIRAWVAEGRPSKHPFPKPGMQIPGRNLWHAREIDRWKAERDAQ